MANESELEREAGRERDRGLEGESGFGECGSATEINQRMLQRREHTHTHTHMNAHAGDTLYSLKQKRHDAFNI